MRMRELLMLCLQTAAPTFSLFGMRELFYHQPFLLLAALDSLPSFVWWGGRGGYARREENLSRIIVGRRPANRCLGSLWVITGSHV
jgi:hypothetical protein